jgi:hypothetical protein
MEERMNGEGEFRDRVLSGDLARLSDAVLRLERAVAISHRQSVDAPNDLNLLREEVEGLRALQKTIAERLDRAIERLKQATG